MNLFESELAIFRDLNRRGRHTEAMQVWYRLRDDYPRELAAWLEAHPGFAPPYGVHIGPRGSEPWRPVKTI